LKAWSVNPKTSEAGRAVRPGIRAVLLFLLLPGIIFLLAIDSWSDYKTLTDITNEAYDSVLLEPARILESSIEFDDSNQLRVLTPLYAQVMLESRTGLRKYYCVKEIPSLQPDSAPAGPSGPSNVLIGMPDLPHPDPWPHTDGTPVFFDAEYRGDPIRAVGIRRDIYHRGVHRQVLILVAESIGKRQATERDALREEFLRDARMLVLVFLLIWGGVAWAVKPLRKLRSDIQARSPDDLTALDVQRVPSEVVPLVDAVNYHVARHRKVLDEQAQFLADASHQLRTPLAIMLTQAQYALREQDEALRREALTAIVVQLRRARRLTEQLLALAHASQGGDLSHQPFDLNALAREVVVQYLPLAREKQQDLGWVGAEADTDGHRHPGVVTVRGSEAELHEAVSNLVHNAINYCPSEAQITVSVVLLADTAEVRITDNGPGLDPNLRAAVFDRFDRGGIAREQDQAGGSGLGLAIARAYAQRSRGDIELRDGELNSASGKGLCAVLWVPFIRDNPSIQVLDIIQKGI
jgi:two-component system sensor histidine kinase TctE